MENKLNMTLKKGNTLKLALKKKSLEKIKMGLGWDVAESGHSTYDLDSFARIEYGENKSETIYFLNLHHGIKTAIFLSGDNLTGEGEGDDESIFIDLPMLVEEYENIKKVRFFINIYEAVVKQQNFSQIKNAFVRVVNLEDESEFLRYDLEKTEDKTAYSVEVGEISYDGSEWTFTAIGKYGHDSTGKLIENSKTVPQGKFVKEKKRQHIEETQENSNETENKKTFLEKLFDFFC